MKFLAATDILGKLSLIKAEDCINYQYDWIKKIVSDGLFDEHWKLQKGVHLEPSTIYFIDNVFIIEDWDYAHTECDTYFVGTWYVKVV